MPQWVTFQLKSPTLIHKAGIYLHGENNQNPKTMAFQVSDDGDNFKDILKTELEHRAGDHLFTFDPPVKALYIRYYFVIFHSLLFLSLVRKFWWIRYFCFKMLLLWCASD